MSRRPREPVPDRIPGGARPDPRPSGLRRAGRRRLGALALAAALSAGCASTGAVHPRPVAFFPGPADARLQASAYDAVASVLRHRGAVVTAARRPAELRALVRIPCGDDGALGLDLRFLRSAGAQTVAVRPCRAAPEGATGIACRPARSVEVDRGCAQRYEATLSTLEAELAEHLAVGTSPRHGEPPWWRTVGHSGLLALVSGEPRRRAERTGE